MSIVIKQGETAWVVKPLRERLPRKGALNSLKKRLKEHDKQYLSVIKCDGHYEVSYSQDEGIDLAQALYLSKSRHALLYVEKLDNDSGDAQYLFIHCIDGFFDEECLNKQGLLRQLKQAAKQKIKAMFPSSVVEL